MDDGLQPEWTMDDPTTFAIDPKLLAWDRERIDPDLHEGSGGDERSRQYVGVWQGTQSHANREELQTILEPNSELYTNSMTVPFSKDRPSSDNDTSMSTGEESQTFPSPSVNSSEAQNDNLLEDPIFQAYVHTARGTPKSPSPGVENAPESSNAKGDGPLTLAHPIVKGYLKLVPHLQHIINHIIHAPWYKKRQQEPPGEDLPVELSLQTRQSSSNPTSLFGEFFSANQPYDCLLCPKEARTQKRSLERALGHSRDHFNFKPIEANRKMYTNLNTKNDQERRAKKPVKFCIPCGKKKITVQNCQRHLQSKAHKTSAANYPEDQNIWSDTK